MTLECDAKLEEKLTCVSENDMRNLENLYQSIRKSQNETLMTSFCLKLKLYELKNYRGVMRHDNEEWCKNWIGIDLSVQNWHEEFDKSWPEHLKFSKICTLMGCFWPKYIMAEPKKVQRIYVRWYWILM